MAIKFKPKQPVSLPHVKPKQDDVKALPSETAVKPFYDRNEAHRIYMKDYMRRKRAADKSERDTKNG